MQTCFCAFTSRSHASADASVSSFELNSEDPHDSLASLRTNPQRNDNLEDVLDRHQAIFGIGQSPVEAPSPTLHPTEPSDTSCNCIESIPSISPSAYDPWDEPEPCRKLQHKEVLLRLQSRAKYIASLPKRGGLQPPTFELRSRPWSSVENMRIGLPPPPAKARPKSLQPRQTSTPARPIPPVFSLRRTASDTRCQSTVGSKPGYISRASAELVTQKSIASLALKQVQERWLQIIQNLQDCSLLAQTTSQLLTDLPETHREVLTLFGQIWD